MSKRVFITNPDGESCAYYCGGVDDMTDLRDGIANIVLAEISEVLEGMDDGPIELRVSVRDMSDAEVASIPDA